MRICQQQAQRWQAPCGCILGDLTGGEWLLIKRRDARWRIARPLPAGGVIATCEHGRDYVLTEHDAQLIAPRRKVA